MRAYKILSFFVVILLITVVFAGAVTVPAAAQGDTATMQFHYNAQHTGDYSPAAGSVVPNNQLKWNFTTGGQVYSSPAVVNGVVYIGGGYQNNNLYALNATTGTKFWNFTTKGYVESSPAVANGVVYVGSADGHVYAINATTGLAQWSQPFATGSVYWSSPAVVNGVVYVGSFNDNVYAINATTGLAQWSQPFKTGSIVLSSPAVSNNVVYVGSDDGNVYAINATTGLAQWSQPFATGSEVRSSPAVANGVVYVGSDYPNFYAINATTGLAQWSQPFATGSVVESSPAVVNGVVYVGSFNDNVYAINATTGLAQWSQPFKTGSIVYSSPAVVNGVVYVGSNDKNVYALNATTGAALWNYTTGGFVFSSPAVVNGVVYVGSDDGNVFAIGNHTTALTAGPSKSIVAPAEVFTVSGTLSAGNGGLPSETVTLYSSTDNATWSKVGDKATAAGLNAGAYSFSVSENTLTAHYYKVTYAGNETLDSSVAYANVNVKVPATISASAPATAYVSQNFTINGTLSADTAGIADAAITLQRSTDNVMFGNVTNTTTDVSGNYQFSNSESAAGTYYYRTAYDGNATYANATSNVVNVLVSTIPTQLTATVSTTTAYVNQNFIINGTLSADTTGLAGATITLQRSTDHYTWNNVSTATTDATGNYQFSNNESAKGTYYYRTVYDGNTTYANATSNAVKVSVTTTTPTMLLFNTHIVSTLTGSPQKLVITYTFTGQLMTTSGTPVANAAIALQSSSDKVHWSAFASPVKTNAQGAYTFKGTLKPGSYYFRTFYAGTRTTGSTASRIAKVVISPNGSYVVSSA